MFGAGRPFAGVTRDGAASTGEGALARATQQMPLEAMDLEEGAHGFGDLLVAVLALDQAVVGVGAERLELRIEPLGQPLGVVERDASGPGRHR